MAAFVATASSKNRLRETGIVTSRNNFATAGPKLSSHAGPCRRRGDRSGSPKRRCLFSSASSPLALYV
jgi:hypothetical protein